MNHGKWVLYLVGLVLAVIFVFPFYWMSVTALKQQRELFSLTPRWLPQHPTVKNFVEVLQLIPFGRYYLNTAIFSFGLLIIQLLTVTPAAYAFARFRFRFKKIIFILFLCQLMIAPQALIIPNYLTLSELGLKDTIWGLMAPYIASAMGVFLLRQGFANIPAELEDAAKIDGCSTLRYLLHVAIPLLKPSYVAFALVSLTYHWNEFFWPLIITDTRRARTLTVGLALFAEASESAAAWTWLMAATLIMIAPLLVIFVFFQRVYIESFMQSGLKA